MRFQNRFSGANGGIVSIDIALLSSSL